MISNTTEKNERDIRKKNKKEKKNKSKFCKKVRSCLRWSKKRGPGPGGYIPGCGGGGGGGGGGGWCGGVVGSPSSLRQQTSQAQSQSRRDQFSISFHESSFPTLLPEAKSGNESSTISAKEKSSREVIKHKDTGIATEYERS